MERWVCAKCGSKWPAYVTIDAYWNRKKAQAVHPSVECHP